MNIESQPHKPNVIFLPYLLPGHLKPMVDTARLFAKHGASVTIITTKANAAAFQKDIDSDFSSGYPIRTHVIHFPAAQLGLPDGAENIKAGTSAELMDKIIRGAAMLKDQIELVFQDLQPDCIVTDMFYPWTVDTAAKLGIPRLYYHSLSYFAGCAVHSMEKHKPHKRLIPGTQKFSIPGLPDNIEMTTLQLEEWVRTKNDMTDYLNAVYESESRSYGTLCNSFHELESDYEQLYKSTTADKSWSVGPVSAWVNRYAGKKANRAHKKEISEEQQLLKWLNSKQNESVLYVSFGSLTRLPDADIVEIAHGLENSGHNFIWVVRNMDGDEDGDSLPQGFEQRMKESKKGYIIWNWAPQLLILNHPAMGGIVTHCGWNTILESLCAGLPMVTWPMYADQFYNEKLLSDVLKVGVPVGAKVNKFGRNKDEDAEVRREEIVKAVKLLLGSGEESKEMRRRARKLSDAAKRATEEGGSSYSNLVQLIDELKSLKISTALSKSKLDI